MRLLPALHGFASCVGAKPFESFQEFRHIRWGLNGYGFFFNCLAFCGTVQHFFCSVTLAYDNIVSRYIFSAMETKFSAEFQVVFSLISFCTLRAGGMQEKAITAGALFVSSPAMAIYHYCSALFAVRTRFYIIAHIGGGKELRLFF